ncbi:FAD-linked oxidase [Endozoicomonas montiporae]|uniref:D-2-hydroxyglutarate dehydrogenase n=2 Tax=Endozoicomonas montiporae TaxID=1027273 RepID=A0A081N3J2_9GAMM|nr:FAD-binding and (Fe-S)-binding domain-containing protein [Endozoicomonas montiporae]AMO58322.1 putative FAD-binding oxidoreductase [Endozoicomonas montiporae CL-33]KEQ13015.1 FAD-linked oxidase [Endozoicomonas montiporae]
MISKLDNKTTSTLYQTFAGAVQSAGFLGDIELGYADRTVLATDNSIYQLLPEGVFYPRSTGDLSLILTQAARPEFHQVVLSPRGGGTGTNGQSLTTGFMVDTSRYMNRVLEINAEERWARVQAGTVKDYLNELAAKEGLFFAPELSTSNRATVGGMVNTDASGQGSVVYGKTRHHVLELTSVLADGTVWASSAMNDDELNELCLRDDAIGKIHQTVRQAHDDNKHQVDAIFPKLNRNLTGYDLANIRNDNDDFDLNAVLCGSEGTLAMVSEIKVNLLPIPKTSALVLVFYQSFQESLQDAQTLMTAKPGSIETIDSRVLGLAKADIVWESVKEFFPENSGAIDGINFVEFTGDSEDELNDGIARLITELNKQSDIQRCGHQIVMGTANVKKIWAMRKQSVGLLGNMEGDARPIPFVEDVAVPPENLAAFIQQFRALLDKHQLTYGMFGHVDSGVLHVRPAIDMKDPQQAMLVRSISDEVARLAQSHGGVLWGEHGKGVRSEYTPAFFAELYPVLQQIKSVFDPHNQLNPGKIATPANEELLKIDGVQTRGELDSAIEREAFEAFTSGLYCNGNGACFNYNPASAMCPTWKATYDRTQSPKGRSGLVREWLRLQSATGTSIAEEIQNVRQGGLFYNAMDKARNAVDKIRGKEDFSHEVYEALDNCMSCKSCAGQCPIQVNIPDLRSRFFELYHSRYPRPLKHHVAGLLEPMLPALAKVKPVYNFAAGSQLINWFASKTVGLQDLPAITSTSPLNDSCRSGASVATPQLLNSLPEEERQRTVIIVQDAFTSFFETPVLTELVELLVRLGYRPLVTPYQPNGKVLHVYGYLGRFEKVARTNGSELNQLAESGVSLIGIDAAVALTYRDEYREAMGDNAPEVLLLSEWFAREADNIAALNLGLEGDYILLGHCTETTNVPAAPAQWQAFYRACGLTLTYQPTGCCGMAGIYGHETRNQAVSRKVYELSWQEVVEKPENQGRMVATGYSCRSQVKRLSDYRILHPVQMLLQVIKANH